MARSDAYERHPEHRLHFDERPVPARVRAGDVQIASTDRALRLFEGSYPPVLYVPREDVRMDRLTHIDQSTHCPFKGDASYFVVRSAAESDDALPVAWSYEDPFDQMLEIKGHLAFYADRVTIEADTNG